jgi:hypothetical protein
MKDFLPDVTESNTNETTEQIPADTMTTSIESQEDI